MNDSFKAAHHYNQTCIAQGQWVEAKPAWYLRRPGWQPIDAAPQDGTEVIAWDGTQRWVAFFWEGDWWSQGIDDNGEYGNDFIVYPTHYQDAPPPPPKQ
jgi:hypothetical protein